MRVLLRLPTKRNILQHRTSQKYIIKKDVGEFDAPHRIASYRIDSETASHFTLSANLVDGMCSQRHIVCLFVCLVANFAYIFETKCAKQFAVRAWHFCFVSVK